MRADAVDYSKPVPGEAELIEQQREASRAHAARILKSRNMIHLMDEVESYYLEGILRAVRTFDASRNVKLSTWCAFHVRKYVYEFLQTCDHLPRHFRKLVNTGQMEPIAIGNIHPFIGDDSGSEGLQAVDEADEVAAILATLKPADRRCMIGVLNGVHQQDMAEYEGVSRQAMSLRYQNVLRHIAEFHAARARKEARRG